LLSRRLRSSELGAKQFQRSRDENKKSIGHLVRKLRLCKHGGNSLVPLSILRIRHLRTIHIREVIHIAARAQSTRPSNLREASFSLILEDGGLTFGLLGDEQVLPQFETGDAVVLFAEGLAAHSQYGDDCCIETPNAFTCKDAFSFRQSRY
jgi:hypothetical protein